jgi:hypothetical protein
MTTTTDRSARGANLETTVRRGSCTSGLTGASDSITREVTSTHPTAEATRPFAVRGPNSPTCSACASDTPGGSLVVRSHYALPDLTLDLLAAMVIESAAKGAKTEAA